MTAPLSDRPRAGSAQRAPAPQPASRPGRRTPPRLRVVVPAPRRHRARLMTAMACAAVVASLFGLVASHVLLTQGQFRLEALRTRAAAEEARYQRLRLQVAELESPSRIVAAAQERLGMVPPPSVTYLSPTGAVSGQAEDASAGSRPPAGRR